MENLDLIPTNKDSLKRIREMINQYKRFGKIDIRVIDVNPGEIIVKATQESLINDRVLTKKELIERAKELFKGEIPDDIKVHVRPVVYPVFNDIDRHYISNKMDEFGLKAKYLCRLLGIDKTSISRILNGTQPMTKWHKAAFYYLFQILSIN